MENFELTGPEAGVALSTLVAFSDDNPSEEEGTVMRRYYRLEDAESLQKKFDEAGINFPNDLTELEPTIVESLKKEDKNFQLRTLAVALELARADGTFDSHELSVLNRFCGELELSLSDADVFAKTLLKEVDETTGYGDYRFPEVGISPGIDLELTIAEAGAALAIEVGMSDDDPSDAEAAVMREYYPVQTVTSLMSKLAGAGLEYPETLPRIKGLIFDTLSKADHDIQKKYLAVAYKVAIADGVYSEPEIAMIEEYCLEYGIGMAELKDYFKTEIAQ